MKKSILFTAILALISLSACSKSYTCTCTYKDDGQVSNTTTTTISEGSKEKSAASCNDMDNTYQTTLNGNTSVHTTECELSE